MIFTIGGIIIKRNGQSKINREQLIAEGGKLALDTNGRKIEYFTYGSNDPNTPVIINIHGSGLDATFEKLIHQKSCEELNVREHIHFTTRMWKYRFENWTESY